MLFRSLAGLGYPVWALGASGGALVLNLVANCVLVPRFGTLGASLAASVSYFVWLAAASRCLKRREEP